MRQEKDRPETPLCAYVLISISFVIGTVAANAAGQSPLQIRHPLETTQRLQPDHDHVRRRWILGVRADATQSGYLIRGVEPNSAASRVGLEPGDRVVTIDGIQIGLVGHKVVRLGDTLERQGRDDGRVRLLVQNRRNGRLVALNVTLRRPNQHLGH
jgi:predicted metalloprotease with PDZ domain